MKRASPTYVEIDLSALRHNYRVLKKRVSDTVKTLSVIKSDAYGHGAAQVARVLDEEGSHFFGVGTIDEGIQLRKAGIKKPILILLGLIEGRTSELLRFQLTPVLYDLAIARHLDGYLKKKKKKMSVHVKVDTGMTRLGVLPQDMEIFCRDIRSLTSLKPQGLMTHLADAGDPIFTERQKKAFFDAKRVFQDYFPKALYHLANSQASLDGNVSESISKKQDMWMARFGVALYGAHPLGNIDSSADLKPVLHWKTCIVSLKKVPPQTPVSYGRTFVTQRETLVAVIPVGYADGYLRALSNRGRGLLKGFSVPIIGRVCMDMMMLDVTDVPGTTIGDEVVLLGRQGKMEIRAEELAEKAGTISYEIFCRISHRVPRVYLFSSKNPKKNSKKT